MNPTWGMVLSALLAGVVGGFMIPVRPEIRDVPALTKTAEPAKVLAADKASAVNEASADFATFEEEALDELGLLLDLFGRAGAAAGQHDRAARGGLDAVLVLEDREKLVRFLDGEVDEALGQGLHVCHGCNAPGSGIR